MKSSFCCTLTGGVVAALLAACGGSQTGLYPAPLGQREIASQVVAQAGCPMTRCIVVGNAGYSSGFDASILFFPRNASGDAPPVGGIEGSKTHLEHPIGIAMDSAGDIYAANWDSNSITVYAAGSQGNVAPIRTIAGSRTTLDSPTGIALDGKDDLYVANNGSNSVAVFAPDAKGNARPSRVISGSKTMLGYPWGVAFDSKSNIYVTNEGSSIAIYAANAKGNVAPKRFISGSLTQLNWPEGIALDASGNAYVTNWESFTLLVFAPGANGDVPPVREDSNGLYAPNGIALDAHGKIYVANGCADDASFVAVYAAGANDAWPLRTIKGDKTRLYCSEGIFVR